MQVISNWYDLRSLHREYNTLICVFFICHLKNVSRTETLHIDSNAY